MLEFTLGKMKKYSGFETYCFFGDTAQDALKGF